MTDRSIFTRTRKPTVFWGINAAITQTQTIIIPAGTHVSSPLDMKSETLYGYVPMAITTPNVWTTAKLSVEVSLDNITWLTLHQWFTNGTFDTSHNVEPNQCHLIDGYVLRGMPYIRFLSGTTAAPVNQPTTASLIVICGTV